MRRTLVAGFLGGLALFFWGAFSHMALGLGEIGIKQMPQEQNVMAAMQAGLTEPGFYFFPGMQGHDASEAAMKEWQARYEQGPAGIVIYNPQGGKVMGAGLMGSELASNILVALIAAWLVMRAGLSFAGRWIAVVAIGVIAAVETNFSYWNWYGFPLDYTLAQMAMTFLGYVVMGVVIAAIVSRQGTQPLAQGAGA